MYADDAASLLYLLLNVLFFAFTSVQVSLSFYAVFYLVLVLFYYLLSLLTFSAGLLSQWE